MKTEVKRKGIRKDALFFTLGKGSGLAKENRSWVMTGISS